MLGHWAAKPAAMTFEEAAGLPTAVETSQRAFRVVGITPGATVLVNGAAGGVGLAAVQLALAEGAGAGDRDGEREQPRLPALASV